MKSKKIDSKNQLENESSLARSISLLGLISVVSGIAITGFSATFAAWLQWNLIGHSIVSGILILPLAHYLYVHFRRTVGIRKPAVLFTGLLCALLCLFLFSSGVWIATKGHQESLSYIGASHAILAYLTILLTALHILWHWFSRRQKSGSREAVFIARPKSLSKMTLLTTVGGYLLCIGVITVAYNVFSGPSSSPVPENYELVYGDHPFRPSQTETTHSELVLLNQIAKSNQCGDCHGQIFDEWKSSAHRQAASDPAYVKNINLLADNKGIAATRYCEGCHAPVALLAGELTTGGQHGGVPDTPAHIEGVGCMGCHGIESVHNSDGTASYKFDAKEHYLFDSSRNLFGQKIRNYLIQASPAKHKQAMGADIMSDPKLCASCHEQFMDKSMNNWGWVKMQSTYKEWLASPFSGQADDNHDTDTSLTCQDCHFSKVISNDPSADIYGKAASHRSLGANTVLPFLNGDDEQLKLTKQFLQSSRMVLHIEKPNAEKLLANDQFVDQSSAQKADVNRPYFLYLGERGRVSVTVTNRLVGHNFPGGTNDINQAWLHFSVIDGNGQTVFESGAINDDQSLSKDSHVYHSVPVDRQGNHVWRHDLFRMTGQLYENSIPAGRSDIKSFEFDVPSWVKSPLTVSSTLNYRKFNQRYASWALDTENPKLPIVNMATDTLTIPIKTRYQATPVTR